MRTPASVRPQAQKNAEALATDHLMSQIGGHAARGSFISLGAQILRLIVQLATMIVLARLLTPADFGLVAMASTVTVFVGNFSDLGLASATVQRREISQETVSALFYTNVAVGVLAMAASMAVAPLASNLFGDPRVTMLLVALSVVLPVRAAAAQHTALLTRGMHFLTLQAINVASQLIAAGVAVAAAYYADLGYWALVLQTWLAALLALASSWIACAWRPTRVTDWHAAKSELAFGLNLTGFNLVNYVHRQFDNVVIGARWGATELGYYSRAYNLFLLPLTSFVWPIGGAILPALSRLQDKPDAWRRTYLTAVTGAVTVMAPTSVLAYFFSSEIIVGLFGPRWAPSGAVLSALALTMALQPIYTSGGWIEVSLGRPGRQLWASIVAAPIYGIAFLVASPWGGVGVAWAYTLAVCVVVVPWLWWATRGTAVRVSDIALACGPPIVLSFGLGLILGVSIAGNWTRELNFMALGTLFVALYVLLLAFYWTCRSSWRSAVEPLISTAVATGRRWLGREK